MQRSGWRWVIITTAVAATIAGIALASCSPIRLVNELSPSNHYQRNADIAYGTLNRQALDVYTPRAGSDGRPVVVFFYGGGWREGKKEDYEFVAASLTEAGYVVVIPDYRLFPEVVFPSFVEDGAMAVAWTLEHAPSFGGDVEQLFLMGHSAGAHIAALLSTDSRFLSRHGAARRQIKGLIGLSGPYDFLPIQSGYLLDVFPESLRQDSQPIDFVTADAPPTLLIHGSDDEVVDPSNSSRLADRLSSKGVDASVRIYDGAGHAVIAAALAPPLDFTAQTLEDSTAFLDTLTERPSSQP